MCGYMACAGYEYVLASVEKLSTVNRGQSLIHRYDQLNIHSMRSIFVPFVLVHVPTPLADDADIGYV